MSGGVGPSGDIRLPKEEPPTPVSKTQQSPQIRRGFLSFRQLNAFAAAAVLSATGMVSVEDIAFFFFSLIYIYFLSKVAFPILSPSSAESVFGRNNKVLKIYILIAAIVGLFLPIAYIFEGIFEGDKEGIKAAAPHVFLLCCQAFMEGVAFSGRFSLPIQVFVPVFYNSRRIFAIVEWLRVEISKVDEQDSGSTRRLYIGRGLAVANMALWCYNLFGFLLPVYLPRAFKKYYSFYKVKD